MPKNIAGCQAFSGAEGLPHFRAAPFNLRAAELMLPGITLSARAVLGEKPCYSPETTLKKSP